MWRETFEKEEDEHKEEHSESHLQRGHHLWHPARQYGPRQPAHLRHGLRLVRTNMKKNLIWNQHIRTINKIFKNKSPPPLKNPFCLCLLHSNSLPSLCGMIFLLGGVLSISSVGNEKFFCASLKPQFKMCMKDHDFGAWPLFWNHGPICNKLTQVWNWKYPAHTNTLRMVFSVT